VHSPVRRRNRRGNVRLAGYTGINRSAVLLYVVLSMIAVTVGVRGAQGSVGYRRIYTAERLIDPTRFPPTYGLSSTLWDSSASDSCVTGGKVETDAARLDSLHAAPPVASPSSITTSPEAPAEPDSSKPAQPDKPPATGDTGAAATATAGASTAGVSVEQPSIGEPAVEEEGETGVEDALPYHPTRIYLVDIPLDITAELDTATQYVVLNRRLSGSELPVSGAMTREVYLERAIQSADRESRRQSVLRRLPKKTESASEGINISIPVFKSKRAQRIFGGSNIGLSVSGNISVSGDLRVEKKDQQQQELENPTNYQFNVNQTQSFVIKGKVGEKVSVDINQNSERLFDFENNLSIRYKGYDDEILQSFEAGNVNMSLGGASLVSGSGSHHGLFGFKTVSKLGALKLTTVASLEKGEKNEIKIEGGAQSSGKKTIPPYDYIANKYFFLDDLYRENYRHRTEFLDHIAVPEDKQIEQIYLYRSISRPDADVALFPGWALYDPDDPNFDPDNPDAQQQQKGNFEMLREGSDYDIFNQLGYVRLNTGIDDDAILAVAYATRTDTVGTLVPSNLEDNIFKLLKPKNPQPTDSTWKLMWRNVYSLKATNISRDGFEGRLTFPSEEEDGKRVESADYLDKGVIPFIQIFGLDWYGVEAGSNRPDGQIDEVFIDFERGELTFPDLNPFYPEGWFKGGEEIRVELDSARYLSPDIYTKTRRELSRVVSDFQIELEYQSVSNTYSLGFNVLKGSVEVIMNGQRLQEGTDYTVDYISGEVTILRTQALTADADVEIKYENAALFQLDTKTLLGLRAEYELWENSHIGATFMHHNQKTLDRRVRVGGEPIRNSIWDIDANLQFKPYFLTRAVDWLPLIETDEPSIFSVKAELAQVFPEPNSLNSPSTGDYNGVAYIDDFESIKRITPLGITRRQWTSASFPEYDDRGRGTWVKKRGRIIWYNPWDQINITDIWPEREVQAQASKVPVMKIEFQPWWNEWGAAGPVDGDPTPPEQYWGGIMRYLGSGYADQSESKYLEIWINRGNANRGVMYVDLGRISEDVIPDNRLNTEDRPMENKTIGNGVVSRDEDTGIDTLAGGDPTDMVDINGDGVMLPSYDDWYYHHDNRQDYSHINGTEGNMEDEGGRYPDTEDLNSDSYTDRANDFFRYRIDLSEGDNNPYIVGGLGNPKGWRLYRIPLKDTLVVGKPLMTSLDYARIWFTGFTHPVSLMLAQIDIVGNEWLEVEVPDGRGGMMDPVSVSVVNTDDNLDYTTPPGVSGELDPVTNLRSKEQSLVLKVNRLHRGETGEVQKLLSHHQKMSLIEYRQLKMFVHLKDRLAGNDRDLEMFLRFGNDPKQRYYEYSRRLKPGWEGNEVVIDFDRLTSLNFLRQKDSLRTYDVLPDGGVIRVEGTPSLRDISFFSLGLKNHGQDIYAQDGVEVWFDELRVSDIQKDPGWAATGSVDLKVARDILTLHADVKQTQSDFHGISKRIGSNKDNLSGRVTAGFKLDALFDPQLALSLPLNASFKQDVEVPKYQTDGDVLLSSLTDKRIDIWSIFLENLKNNNRYRDDSLFQGPVDRQIATSKSFSYSFRAIKNKLSDNPFTRYTVERISLRDLSYSRSYSTSSSSMYRNSRKMNGNLEYNLSFDRPVELSWLSWAENLPLLGKVSQSRLTPLPTSFSAGVGAVENMGQERKWNRPDEVEDYRLNTDRRWGIGFRPVSSLSFDFSQSVEADRVRSDSARYYVALNLSELDSLDYWVHDSDTTEYFDSTRWEDDLERDIEGIKDRLFWKAFGSYFIDNRFSQNLSVNFSPNFVSWLGISSNYSPRYNWSWSQANYGPGNRDVSLSSTLSTNFTLRLPQILRSWREGGKAGGAPTGGDIPPYGGDWDNLGSPPSGGSGESTGSGGGGPPPWERGKGIQSPPPMPGTGTAAKGEVIPGETIPDSLAADSARVEKEKPPAPSRDPLLLVKAVLTRLHDISWSYTRSNNIRNPAVSFGQANWKYRLGLTRDPGLRKAPGFTYTDSYSNTIQHSFSSGLDITQNLNVTRMSYDFGSTYSKSQSESGGYTRTVWQYFDSDGITIKSIPALNWSINWSGWERLPVLNRLATSVSLNNSFSGQSRESWTKSINDSARVTQSVDYEKNFAPLIGLSISWKGGISSDASLTINQTVTDQRIGKRKTKNYSREFRLRGGYTTRKGFRIPIPVWPFKNRRLKNQTSFSLTYENRNSRAESSANNARFNKDDPDREDKSWSLRPSIDYKFSNMVTGSFHYEYAVQESQIRGRTQSQDFGFEVRITIRG